MQSQSGSDSPADYDSGSDSGQDDENQDTVSDDHDSENDGSSSVDEQETLISTKRKAKGVESKSKKSKVLDYDRMNKTDLEKLALQLLNK